MNLNVKTMKTVDLLRTADELEKIATSLEAYYVDVDRLIEKILIISEKTGLMPSRVYSGRKSIKEGSAKLFELVRCECFEITSELRRREEMEAQR